MRTLKFASCLTIGNALFSDLTQRRLTVYYRRFGTTSLSHLQGSCSTGLLKMRQIGCSETSVRDHQFALRKIPEANVYHLHRCGCPKSRTDNISLASSSLSFSIRMFPPSLCIHWKPICCNVHLKRGFSEDIAMCVHMKAFHCYRLYHLSKCGINVAALSIINITKKPWARSLADTHWDAFHPNSWLLFSVFSLLWHFFPPTHDWY